MFARIKISAASSVSYVKIHNSFRFSQIPPLPGGKSCGPAPRRARQTAASSWIAKFVQQCENQLPESLGFKKVQISHRYAPSCDSQNTLGSRPQVDRFASGYDVEGERAERPLTSDPDGSAYEPGVGGGDMKVQRHGRNLGHRCGPAQSEICEGFASRGPLVALLQHKGKIFGSLQKA